MKKLLTLLFALILIDASAQTNFISTGIRLPSDSITKIQLLASLDGFLQQKEKPPGENSYIKENLLETSVLMDEFKEIEKNNKLKIDTFYKCYLTNVVALKDSNYIIQLSYSGVNNSQPVTRASFTLIARKKGDAFTFQSPVKYNTKFWKRKKMGNATVYFKDRINMANAKSYFNLIDKYDKKLNATGNHEEYYCCEDFHEALKLIGVDYKLDYNGRSMSALTAKEKDVYINVNGLFTPEFVDVDPHDLWHSRLHKVLSVSVINKPVDEGTAFLYGGSWGMTWEEILRKFKTYAAANPNADWLALYNDGKNYDEGAKFPLNVDYTINALIVRKLEREKGFPAVMELLACGKYQKGNENYFAALERIAGISKTDFNNTVNSMINSD